MQQTVSIISIPSGAIKRIELRDRIYQFQRFQFLLVRLRVLCYIFLICDKHLFQFLLVRLRGKQAMAKVSFDFEFQFLLVRLRDGGLWTSPIDSNYFQFLLVRLRGLYIDFQYVNDRCSLSIARAMVRKTFRFHYFLCQYSQFFQFNCGNIAFEN